MEVIYRNGPFEDTKEDDRAFVWVKLIKTIDTPSSLAYSNSFVSRVGRGSRAIFGSTFGRRLVLGLVVEICLKRDLDLERG